MAFAALAVELGGEAVEAGEDPRAWALAAMGAAFRAAAALGGMGQAGPVAVRVPR